MKLRSRTTAAGVAAGVCVGPAALLLSLTIGPPNGAAFAQTKKASQTVKPADLPKLTDDVDDPAV